MATPKEPKAGSRMSETRADAASKYEEVKRKALKRSVKDKTTGALVYPTDDSNAYSKAQTVAAIARIKTNAANAKKYEANKAKAKKMSAGGVVKAKK